MNEILNNYSEAKIFLGYDDECVMNVRGSILCYGIEDSDKIIVMRKKIKINDVKIPISNLNAVEIKMKNAKFVFDLSDLIRIIRYFLIFKYQNVSNINISYDVYDPYDIIFECIVNRKYCILGRDSEFRDVKFLFRSALFEKYPKLPKDLADLILEFDNPNLDDDFLEKKIKLMEYFF